MERAAAILKRATADHAAGRLASAQRHASRALRLASASLGKNDINLAPIFTTLAHIGIARGDIRGAIHHFTRALALLESADHDVDARRLEVETRRALAHLFIDQARYAEAEQQLERALARGRKLGKELGRIWNAIGMLCKYTAQFARGRRAYRRALQLLARKAGGDDIATVLHNLGGIEHAAGRFRAAEPHARRSVEIRRRLLGPHHLAVAADEAALAAILDGLERFDESEPLYRRALAAFRKAGARYDVTVTLNNLAAVAHARGRLSEAERLYRRALREKRSLLGAAHPDVAITLYNLSRLLGERGKISGARPLARRAQVISERRLGRSHPLTRACAGWLARLESARFRDSWGVIVAASQ